MEINMFETRTMMDAVTRMAPVTTFLRDTFFKNIATFPTNKVDVDFKKGNRRLAPFVHPVIGGKVLEHKGYQTNTYEPPLVAPDKITKASDLLNRLPGEHVYSPKTPEERAAERLGQDLAELDETVTRREEWMCAQTLFTGKIPVIGEGINEVIDFGFSNKETLSGTSLWSDSNSDPIAYLKAKHAEVQKNGFVNCDVCIMSQDVVAAFISHPKVKDVLDKNKMDYATIAPRQLPNGATYVGTINELGLDIYQYNAWYLDDWTNPKQPQTLPLVPVGTLALLSTQANYSMYYAGVEVADAKTDSIEIVEGTRVPTSWVEKRPARRIVNVSAKPLSVPHEVDSWFVSKVLA